MSTNNVYSPCFLVVSQQKLVQKLVTTTLYYTNLPPSMIGKQQMLQLQHISKPPLCCKRQKHLETC